MISSRRRLLVLALCLSLAVGPGCILGSPLAAVSGEPYGMVRDDVKALQGKNGPIWAGAPFFAALDLPVAFCLDTAFLPLALITWGIYALGEDEDETVWSRHGEDVEPEDAAPVAEEGAE
ncbi:MAG: YceK/YidQ family lipoprotein [Planctomycetota bacterium]|nr:MAG: YceK/YidQ family lipoprotein [Planctomycetota bacterium]